MTNTTPSTVTIGGTPIGDGQPCYVIGEIGINHNGEIDIVRRLIDAAADADAQAVKFQKRTLEVVYTSEELAAQREHPFGTTNGDLKRHLELDADDYRAIHAHSTERGIHWFASCWDEESVAFMEQFEPVAYKIASASITDTNLLKRHRETERPIIISTGMSSIEEIDVAVETLGTDNLIVLHCTSTYPSTNDELNLRCIPMLKERYGVPIGYSGHEIGLATSVAAVAIGACVVERHITLDRAMFGSDQAASVEMRGFARMVRDIRAVSEAMGDGVKRVYESEIPVRDKLRRVG